ncbi:MAG: nicotinamide riboside transporter PnuC [Thermoanaerobaculia bacterium]
MSPLEIMGAATGALGVWLMARENVWCWPVGLVNVAVYALVFHDAKLYADMGLQVVYFALCLYGWWAWMRGGAAHGRLVVSRAPAAVLAACALAGIAFAAALGVFLRAKTDAALPFWDAGTTGFSLVAQFLQTRKWIENWLLWIAVDIVYVGMYVVKRLYLTAGLYALFLVLAGIGLASWRRSLEEAAAT